MRNILQCITAILIVVLLLSNQNVLAAKNDTIVKIAAIGRWTAQFEQYIQFARFQLDLINNSTDLLPNTTLQMIPYEAGSDAQIIAMRQSVQAGVLDGCTAFLGGFQTLHGVSTGSLSAAFNLPFMPIAGGRQLVTRLLYPYLARTIPYDKYMGELMARYIKNIGWQRMAVFNTGDLYGTGNQQAFLDGANLVGMTANYFTMRVGRADYSTDVKSVNATGIRVMVILCDYAEGIVLLRNFRDMGFVNKDYFYILNQQLYDLIYMYNNATDIAMINGMVGLGIQGKSGPLGDDMLQQWVNADPVKYPSIRPRSEVHPNSWYLAENLKALALGLNITNSKGIPHTNGAQWYNNIVAMKYQGITGPVAFETGERITNLIWYLYNSNTTSRTIFSVYNGTSGTFRNVAQPVFIGGRTDYPRDIPCPCQNGNCQSFNSTVCVCFANYDGGLCEVYVPPSLIINSSSFPTRSLALSIVLPVLAVIAAAVIIAYYMYRRKRGHLVQEIQQKQRSNIPRKEIKVTSFIGRGASGEVFSANFRGTKVAVKVLSTKNTTPQELKDVELESAIMCGLRHPNIVLFMGSCTDGENKELLLVMEYMAKGSLNDVIRKNKTILNDKLKLHIAYQAALGINFLHQSNPPIIHCDIKSHNIFLDDKWCARVGDFGITRIQEISGKNSSHAKALGTIFWAAPEVLNGQSHSTKSDTYAFGVMLWELFHLTEPYHGQDPVHVALSVIQKGSRPAIAEHVPAAVATLIRQCWEQDPSRRPDFDAIAEQLQQLSVMEQLPLVTVDTFQSAGFADPKKALFFVAVSIDSFYQLWDAFPSAMHASVAEFATVLKSQMDEHHGYHTKRKNEDGDGSTLVVFQTIENAMNFVLGFHQALLKSTWPRELDENPRTMFVKTESGAVLWSGLRAKIAVHKGVPTTTKNDFGSINYEGAVVDDVFNLLEMVHPGMTLVSEPVSNVMGKNYIINYEKEQFTPSKLIEVKFKETTYGVVAKNLLERMQTNFDDALSALERVSSVSDIIDPSVTVSMRQQPQWVISKNDIGASNQHVRTNTATLYRAQYKGSTEVMVKTYFNESMRIPDVYYIGATCSKLSHPNIAQVHGISLQADRFSVIMEYATHGSLQDYLANSAIPLTMQDKLRMAREIAQGMKYIDKYPDPMISVHKNLKSTNVLVTAKGTCKIADYGMNSLYEDMRTLTSVGLVQWIPPELFEGTPHTQASPVYSYGVILYEILTRKLPYNQNTHPIKLVHEIQYGLRPEIPASCPPAYKNLMELCWAANPLSRPSWETILSILSNM